MGKIDFAVCLFSLILYLILFLPPDKNPDCDTSSIFTIVQSAYEKLKDTAPEDSLQPTTVAQGGKSARDSHVDRNSSKNPTELSSKTRKPFPDVSTTNDCRKTDGKADGKTDSSKQPSAPNRDVRSKSEKAPPPSAAAPSTARDEAESLPMGGDGFFFRNQACNVSSFATTQLRNLLKEFGVGKLLYRTVCMPHYFCELASNCISPYVCLTNSESEFLYLTVCMPHYFCDRVSYLIP